MALFAFPLCVGAVPVVCVHPQSRVTVSMRVFDTHVRPREAVPERGDEGDHAGGRGEGVVASGLSCSHAQLHIALRGGTEHNRNSLVAWRVFDPRVFTITIRIYTPEKKTREEKSAVA